MNKREKEQILYQTFSRACYELELAGITIGTVDGIKINTRAKSRWGQCRTINGRSTIEISDMLFEAKNPKALITVVIHELLHTINPYAHHGGEWAEGAKKMNALYGYNIKRASSPADYQVEYEAVKKHYKYRVYCPVCGASWRYERRCQSTERAHAYRCGCGHKGLEVESL